MHYPWLGRRCSGRIRIESSTIKREELSRLRLKSVERGARDSSALCNGQRLAFLQDRHVWVRACIVLVDRLYIVYDKVSRQKLASSNSMRKKSASYLSSTLYTIRNRRRIVLLATHHECFHPLLERLYIRITKGRLLSWWPRSNGKF